MLTRDDKWRLALAYFRLAAALYVCGVTMYVLWLHAHTYHPH